MLHSSRDCANPDLTRGASRGNANSLGSGLSTPGTTAATAGNTGTAGAADAAGSSSRLASRTSAESPASRTAETTLAQPLLWEKYCSASGGKPGRKVLLRGKHDSSVGVT